MLSSDRSCAGNRTLKTRVLIAEELSSMLPFVFAFQYCKIQRDHIPSKIPLLSVQKSSEFVLSLYCPAPGKVPSIFKPLFKASVQEGGKKGFVKSSTNTLRLVERLSYELAIVRIPCCWCCYMPTVSGIRPPQSLGFGLIQILDMICKFSVNKCSFSVLKGIDFLPKLSSQLSFSESVNTD